MKQPQLSYVEQMSEQAGKSVWAGRLHCLGKCPRRLARYRFFIFLLCALVRLNCQPKNIIDRFFFFCGGVFGAECNYSSRSFSAILPKEVTSDPNLASSSVLSAPTSFFWAGLHMLVWDAWTISVRALVPTVAVCWWAVCSVCCSDLPVENNSTGNCYKYATRNQGQDKQLQETALINNDVIIQHHSKIEVNVECFPHSPQESLSLGSAPAAPSGKKTLATIDYKAVL